MDPKTAKVIVTGGASGLGFAVAQRFVGIGAQMAILDLDPTGGERIASALGKDVFYLAADVTSESSVDQAVQAVADQFGGVSLAVNCAGIVHSQRVVGRGDGGLTQVDFARVIAVNLIGTFTVCRAVAHVMQRNVPNAAGERGVIVNTASIAAYEGQIGLAAYAASKGGVASLTLPLAREFASLGVRVMAIAPGLFATPMFAGLPDKVKARLAEDVPFPRRLGDPKEFAELVCHIYQNPMLNGEVIRLDGALRMPPK
jgi:NAD(P)-dependent dehydrogenase (short-subunit alcohol dehydrogenase family)